MQFFHAFGEKIAPVSNFFPEIRPRCKHRGVPPRCFFFTTCMNASQKDYRALSSSLPLGDSLFSLSYSVRFVKNFFLLFSKPFRRFSTRFELFRPPPLAKQLIYITRCHPHCQELFSPFFSFLFQTLCGAFLAALTACGFTLLERGLRRCAPALFVRYTPPLSQGVKSVSSFLSNTCVCAFLLRML